MTAVKVRNIELGQGRPKIAVPLTGKTQNELCEQAKNITTENGDLVEWRLDNFADVLDESLVSKTAQSLRGILGGIPLLATFRTEYEGGQMALKNSDDYFMIYKNIITGHMADLIDVELFRTEENVKKLVSLGHENEVAVVMSNHEFTQTPTEKEILQRLKMMQEFGADIAKIAVMPRSVEDVLTLLQATFHAKQKLQIPLITMSMGNLGKISRVTGELFGSCLSFGTVGTESAPGQIESGILRKILGVLQIE